MLSTQASTKVYRSPVGASLAFHARVGADATLVCLPDPVVCFAQSTYRQSQQFDLCASSTFVLLDWLTSGRVGFGERWMFDEYRSTLLVRVESRLILHDSLRLTPVAGALADRFGRFNVLATLVLVGPGLASQIDEIDSTVSARVPARRSNVLVACSRLRDGGAILRLAGTSVETVRHEVHALLAFIPALVGDDPWARKW
jgi:urease accessory protein